MKLNPLVQSILTFLIRRGLTLLGTAGLAVSDEWIAQTASLGVVAINEGINWWQAHRKGAEKATTKTIAP